VSQDQFSSEKRSWIMSKVRSCNTSPEVKLRRELWRKGLRYRVQVGSLPGKPDIVFLRAKVAIFVDGAFWHGRKLSEERLDRMSDYWRHKIRRNVERDTQNNEELEKMGYLVVRCLDKEVMRQTSEVVTRISDTVSDRLKNK
jgi:DNA mismatch endonuclease (patch repair protein)